MQYPLDRLHYVMFQLLFFVLVPSLLAVSQTTAGAEKNKPIAASDEGSGLLKPLHARDTGNPHTTGAVVDSSHAYTEKCAEIERYFMTMAASAMTTTADDDDSSSPWTSLVTIAKPYPITVQGHAERPFCFRVIFYAPASPATAFDLLANILRRTEWDELTDTTRVVQGLGKGDAIHYVKMKGIWPTAARDSVLISRITAIRTKGNGGEGEEEDGFLNVSQSIEDSRIPEKQAEGIVRMEATLAGQLVTNVSRDDRARFGLEGENWCKVVQIADGDMKGWIPKSVIKFVATQALPRSLTKVCRLLAAIPSTRESLLLLRPPTEAALSFSPGDPEKPAALSARAVVASPASAALLPSPPPPPPSVVAPPPPSTRAVVRVGRATWMGWTRVILRYATPAVIAALTSLVFHFYMRRRR
ncbi:hypothetical protein GGI00_001253 [Coemansia sp. RSA 2681]|nr:hypothetical protein GGI00_001253 [Coemansia sp. RSA 2681]